MKKTIILCVLLSCSAPVVAASLPPDTTVAATPPPMERDLLRSDLPQDGPRSCFRTKEQSRAAARRGTIAAVALTLLVTAALVWGAHNQANAKFGANP